MSITEETRREAFYEVQNTAETRKKEIYRVLRECGPMTSDEIMDKLGYTSPNSVRPRLTELKQEGLVEACGKKLAKCGRVHIAVWQVAESQVHITVPPSIDYSGLSDYAKAWPDKLVSFFCEHAPDDEYNEFVRDFWEHCQDGDKDGPAIGPWLES